MKPVLIVRMISARLVKAGASVALALAGIVCLVVSAAGCGHAARTTAEYRTDTRSLLHTRERSLAACYAGLLATDPAAEGRVRVRFAIAKETGTVTEPQVEPAGTTAPPELQQCVLRALDGLELAPPDRVSAEATFVWIFQRPPPPRPKL